MAANGSRAPVQGQATTPGSSSAPPRDTDMQDEEDSEGEEEITPEAFKDLKRQGAMQARQLASLLDLVSQLTGQITARPRDNGTTTHRKPKVATPEKYEGGRTELRAFLTNIDLYCELNDVPDDQEKILTATMHMKGRAANWAQPYVEDYLKSRGTGGEKQDTQNLFRSWNNFKEEMGRIFGEIDAESQAEKAITHLRQTKSVSAYTAEFKQLQSRIDWDDAALRTVFENGLKDTIKDSLIHHDKPETLQATIELATRIDNRLWERNQQRNKTTPMIANTKKHRRQVRMDKDGDIIMTDKVQTGKRKTYPKKSDGLSKEERQKRYDSKACLRCGEVGHFRKDCPKNEPAAKEGAVKIGMIGQANHLKPAQPSDSEVSDMELYEEARALDNSEYELVPRAQEAATVIKAGEPMPQDRQVTSTEVNQRLHKRQCWGCGNKRHQADDCIHHGRTVITGPKAYVTAHRALEQQPYFENSEDEVEEPTSIRESVEEAWQALKHQRIHWVDCESLGPYHQEKRKNAGWSTRAKWHRTLADEECYTDKCTFHDKTSPAPGDDSGVMDTSLGRDAHNRIHWSFCIEDHCQMHYHAKMSQGYFPKKRQMRRSKN